MSKITTIKVEGSITINDIIRNEPADIYHKKSEAYLSSHALADFRKSPLLYHKKTMGLIPRTDSAAFVTGRAVHTLVLEGEDAYKKQHKIGGPMNSGTGKEYGSTSKKFKEYAVDWKKQNKQLLTSNDDELVRNVAAAIDTNQEAQNLLANGIPEAVIRTPYHDMPCQIRMDWYVEGRAIVDLKTCDQLQFFEHDSKKYGYIYQLAFYRAVLECVIGKQVPVYLIAVEKNEPFRCGVWRIGKDLLAEAQKTNEEAMARLLACVHTNEWETGYESIRTIDTL